MKLTDVVQNPMKWFANKPYRALDQAYNSILTVKSLEDDHFNGKKISYNSNYSESVVRYFESEIKRHLNVAESGLREFELSEISRQNNNSSKSVDHDKILDKIKLINYYLVRYGESYPLNRNSNLAQIKPKVESISNKTSVLPRSFLTTLKRIQQEIDPKSGETEEQVLNKFRRSRYKTAVSIKFFLLLIIIPLLTHQIVKTFVIQPILTSYSINHEQVIFINDDFEEEAFQEMQIYEHRLHFEEMIGKREKTSLEEKEHLLEEKAREIAESYKDLGTNAIANIFADVFSLLAFGLVIVFSKKEIAVVKSFIDEVAYGLSDSAKAFLIILLTDIFVGYHSPHGWEIILEGIARHLGLPENREFNFLFIATFPVILDTILKYWIFRYLNRISPSAVATYRNMNE
jgi:hypothetical protein